MNAASAYVSGGPSRAEIASTPGHTVIEFGSNLCGICQAAQPVIAEALGAHVGPAPLRHLKVEDGPGQPLGRSFGIKWWPTLVVLRDGQEVARVVRPRRVQDIEGALAPLAARPSPDGS
ncbi:MAG TPA: thioredoxin family protein [Hydrogenophaga sp.]|uniref:thioredoxin family protein n=1 Tax=Hydrogenophaga sp. TaxID=1904254 RepID=UPI002BB19954|nr:thioredoxin family protein [Hydrogenophaga sp.]HSX93840.1 thioredoxin family protein [Hydrogenophaga sp.]